MNAPNENETPRPVSRRRPGVALLLAILTPGLGQIYNGQLKKAVSGYIIVILLFIAMMPLLLTFPGAVVTLSTVVLVDILLMANAWTTARRIGSDFEPRRYNNVRIYIAIILLSAFVIGPAVLAVARHMAPAKAYHIPSSGMSPGLQIGDVFMADKRSEQLREFGRGDIIVFRRPGDPTIDIAKRVIGLPGETVEIREKQVLIDGEPLEDPWAHHIRQRALPQLDEFSPLKIPPDHLFVLGDNRDNSHDSRLMGPIPVDRVVGKGLYIYFSRTPGRIGMRLNRHRGSARRGS
jgi:signal peptidase I